jgi:hypothetical protein
MLLTNFGIRSAWPIKVICHFADGTVSKYADANWQHHDNKRARKTPERWVAPGFADRPMGASVVVGNNWEVLE